MWRKLCVEQCILQNADLLVLDESLAALDPENLRLALSLLVIART
jgi:ABC-type Mn2+/Zn2+ transport system ATPase subunit